MGEPFDMVGAVKYDGTSISLTYENGRLVRAVTRGDGVKGDDNRKYTYNQSIPLQLREDYPQNLRLEEILMWTVFEALNERGEAGRALFANPVPLLVR
ncbi:MAG: hypothetical protein ACLRTD_24980 [Bacteroides sp.]